MSVELGRGRPAGWVCHIPRKVTRCAVLSALSVASSAVPCTPQTKPEREKLLSGGGPAISSTQQIFKRSTDADALLARKGSGKEAKLSYSGHVLMENRNGLVADAEVLQANGTAERDAALVMIEAIPGDHPVTVGGDKGYDTKDFVAEARNLKATPHVA